MLISTNHSPPKFPYTLEEFDKENPNITLPENPSDEILASVGLYKVQSTQSPAYDSLTQLAKPSFPALVDGQWIQQWVIEDLTPEQIATAQENIAKRLQTVIVSATQRRLDNFARTRNYDGLLSLCTYATDPNPEFRTEGQYGVEIRSTTWAKLYEIMAEVQAGTRPAPTRFEDIEPLLPTLEWPV